MAYRELIKRIACQLTVNHDCEIRMYDTGKRDNRGCTVIEVELDLVDCKTKAHDPIFTGSDMYMSPGRGMCDDSDESVRSAIDLVSMRPGDTDKDWFNGYSEKQLDWANSYTCETLQMYSLEPDDLPEDNKTPWIDLDLE